MSPETIPEPHPGEILLEEFIKPAAITPYRVAKDSGIFQPTMNQIVNSKRLISTETALRLATYLGTSCELWVNLQKNYDTQRRARLAASDSSGGEAAAIGSSLRRGSDTGIHNGFAAVRQNDSLKAQQRKRLFSIYAPTQNA